MVVVIVVIATVTLSLLQRHLVSNLDDELKSSGTVVAGNALNTLASDINDTPDPSLLSDYYLSASVSTDSRGSTQLFTRVNTIVAQRYGIPAATEDLLERWDGSSQVFTVEGTQARSQWRVVILPVTNGPNTIGKILIARPLAPIHNTVMQVALILLQVALGVVTLGALLTWAFVRRSFKPLRDIEHSTHAIAAGDLSRRVPEGREGSEVGMLAASINAMLAQIEHAFAVKARSEAKMRQFVSDASHELRTPLATVRGYAELYRLGGVPADKIPQTMDRIESEAHRMSGLVEDLLQLARLDEGRPLVWSSVDITRVCRNAVEDLRVRDSSRPASVIGLDGAEPADITVTADEDKITQVVTNLLSNVLTHTPAGSSVEVAVGKPTPSEAVVEVRDHGPGVRPEDAAHLFERFYRTDYSRSRASGGSGLGLAIVAAIMAAHGGTARLAETAGGGLTVRLSFPVQEKHPAEATAHASGEQQTHSNKAGRSAGGRERSSAGGRRAQKQNGGRGSSQMAAAG
ncbi:sensor histidine kinase [Actinobaculum sp. 313]|nr:sensor histidine kinase [Actinobaculum sp. 313]